CAAAYAASQLANSRWDAAVSRDSGLQAAFGRVPAKYSAPVSAWDQSIRPADWQVAVTYNPAPTARDASTSPRYQRVDEFGPRFDAALELERSLYVPGRGPLVFNFGGQRYSPSSTRAVYFDFRDLPPSKVIQPVDSGADVAWRPARQVGLPMQIGRA